MTFTTSDILTPQPTRADFAAAFGNNQRLIRFFEQLTADVRQTLPDAIVSLQDISGAPFIVQSASALVPNAFVLSVGNGLTQTVAPGSLGVALSVPVVIANGGTSATTAAAALTNLGGVTAAQAAAAAPVQSVFGRIGTVTAQSGDYSVGQVTGAAPLASPALTGVPTVPTAAPGTNTTQAASTAYVQTAISGLATGVSSFNGRTGAVVPASGDYAVAQVTGAAPLASPALTGTPTMPTAPNGTATTQGASTAFVNNTLSATFGAPPGIGTGTPNTGAFTTLTASGTVTGAGFTALLAPYAPLASPSFTGVPAVPTAALHTSSTQAASCQFVENEFAAPPNIGTSGAPGVIVSQLFETATGTASVATGTATTVYTFGNTTPQAWLVSANIGLVNDTADYGAFAVILTDGTTARLALSSNGARMTLTLSGLVLQATQTSGATQTVHTVLTRIG